MKILITGGFGFVGKNLTMALFLDGHTVTVVDKYIPVKEAPNESVQFLQADTTVPGEWQTSAGDSDIIINLAGSPIFKRWDKKLKKSIYESRILTTRNVVDALKKNNSKTARLINASAVGYYGYHGDDIIDEGVGQGDDFLARIAGSWEAEALNAEKLGVKVALCRFGIVMGKGGGAFPLLKYLFELHFGSRLGNGLQWFPWIHEDDLARIFSFIINNKIDGVLNCTSPNPVRNRELAVFMTRALETWSFMPPMPAFLIRFILGEFGKTVLLGQRAVPKRLTDLGFTFNHPEFEEAIRSLI